MRTTIVCLLFIISIQVNAQIAAKAIAYAVEVDLEKFNPNVKGEDFDKICRYEIDAYYTTDKLRTQVRNIFRPEEFELTIRQRLYTLASNDEYNIDHENEAVLFKKGHVYNPKATGKEKKILNYVCKEYTFKDFRNVQISVWVTDKLPKNICPAGNFNLKGAALEILTSNGMHFVATDFEAGELPDDFFNLPTGYAVEEIPAPSSQKKK
ncbi:MAG: hypothetical protein JNM57_00820 [Cyclobacteriaceae bacterium]|nr:hypothetical protein [Cyclobacteriaceae bacterium]